MTGTNAANIFAKCERCGATVACSCSEKQLADASSNRATVCERCGSGLLDGKHIASYPPCNGEDATRNRVEQVARIIADGVIAWADEVDDASRYPIPPWTVYEAIAQWIVEGPDA